MLADERRRAAGGRLPVLRVSFAKLLELCVKPMWLWVDLGEGILTEAQLQQILKRGYARMRQYLTPPRRARSCPRAIRQPIRPWPRLRRAHAINGPMQFRLV